jgi:hypothetical protein
MPSSMKRLTTAQLGFVDMVLLQEPDFFGIVMNLNEKPRNVPQGLKPALI